MMRSSANNDQRRSSPYAENTFVPPSVAPGDEMATTTTTTTTTPPTPLQRGTAGVADDGDSVMAAPPTPSVGIGRPGRQRRPVPVPVPGSHPSRGRPDGIDNNSIINNSNNNNRPMKSVEELEDEMLAIKRQAAKEIGRKLSSESNKVKNNNNNSNISSNNNGGNNNSNPNTNQTTTAATDDEMRAAKLRARGGARRVSAMTSPVSYSSTRLGGTAGSNSPDDRHTHDAPMRPPTNLASATTTQSVWSTSTPNSNHSNPSTAANNSNSNINSHKKKSVQEMEDEMLAAKRRAHGGGRRVSAMNRPVGAPTTSTPASQSYPPPSVNPNGNVAGSTNGAVAGPRGNKKSAQQMEDEMLAAKRRAQGGGRRVSAMTRQMDTAGTPPTHLAAASSSAAVAPPIRANVSAVTAHSSSSGETIGLVPRANKKTVEQLEEEMMSTKLQARHGPGVTPGATPGATAVTGARSNAVDLKKKSFTHPGDDSLKKDTDLEKKRASAGRRSQTQPPSLRHHGSRQVPVDGHHHGTGDASAPDMIDDEEEEEELLPGAYATSNGGRDEIRRQKAPLTAPNSRVDWPAQRDSDIESDRNTSVNSALASSMTSLQQGVASQRQYQSHVSDSGMHHTIDEGGEYHPPNDGAIPHPDQSDGDREQHSKGKSDNHDDDGAGGLFSRGCTKREYIIALATLCLIGIPAGLVLGFVLGGGGGDDNMTSPPSPAPITFDGQIQDIIGTKFRLDDDEDISSLWDDPESPQAMAIDWLINHDDITKSTILPMLEEENNFDDIDTKQLEQRYAAAVFYFSTAGEFPTNDNDDNNNSNSGGNWIKSYDFLNPTINECQWNTLSISNQLSEEYITAVATNGLQFQGIICNDQNEVLTIAIKENGLAGTLPQELIAFSSLISLNLENNLIGGTLPEFQLKEGLPVLQELDLQKNKITGSLPSYTHWTNMRFIELEDNAISSTLPANWQFMTNLERLSLQSNNLIGTLPTNWKFFDKLIKLELSSNSIDGTVPLEILQLPNLETLRLDFNALSGTLPSSATSSTSPVSYGTSLRILNLINNKLSGQFPWTSLHAPFRWLRISSNSFSGTVPWDVVANDINPVFLEAGLNKFSGSITSDIGNITRLESITLNSNSLNGTIPTEIGMLSNLRSIQFGSNFFSGTLPSEIGNIQRLSELLVGNNVYLSGTIPTEFQQLNRLNRAVFSDTNINGNFDILCPLELNLLSADCDEEDVTCTCCTTCSSI